MITEKYIVFLVAILLISCTSVQVPIDDAYYWPDKIATHVHSHSDSDTSGTSSTSTASGTSGTSIEYTHVQDTTVTIKIKR